MNYDLYNKYGEYNIDGYYIENHGRWDYYANRPNLYKRKKILAFIWLVIPICGVIVTSLKFEEMGLSLF